MRIDSANIASNPLATRRQQADENLQSVFSEVLLAAGREGYASAAPLESGEPIAEQVQATWNDWYGLSAQRYRDIEGNGQLRQEYGNVLARSLNEGGYADPKGFLDTLSDDQLEVVQNVHRLAFPIKRESLTEEGALNLLIPPPAQVDLDFDGLTRTGKAYGIRFPDSRTPPEVAAAWHDATADLSERERMFYSLQMKLPVLLANITLDDQGAFVSRREPGDPDFVNPLADPGYSYVEATRDRLNYLDLFRNQMPAEQYERGKSFWASFQQSLLSRDAK